VCTTTAGAVLTSTRLDTRAVGEGSDEVKVSDTIGATDVTIAGGEDDDDEEEEEKEDDDDDEEVAGIALMT
jgi:hypothetical protein